jgi:hypothetical protein
MPVINPAVRQKIEDHGLSIAEVEAVLLRRNSKCRCTAAA